MDLEKRKTFFNTGCSLIFENEIQDFFKTFQDPFLLFQDPPDYQISDIYTTITLLFSLHNQKNTTDN